MGHLTDRKRPLSEELQPYRTPRIYSHVLIVSPVPIMFSSSRHDSSDKDNLSYLAATGILPGCEMQASIAKRPGAQPGKRQNITWDFDAAMNRPLEDYFVSRRAMETNHSSIAFRCLAYYSIDFLLQSTAKAFLYVGLMH